VPIDGLAALMTPMHYATVTNGAQRLRLLTSDPWYMHVAWDK